MISLKKSSSAALVGAGGECNQVGCSVCRSVPLPPPYKRGGESRASCADEQQQHICAWGTLTSWALLSHGHQKCQTRSPVHTHSSAEPQGQPKGCSSPWLGQGLVSKAGLGRVFWWGSGRGCAVSQASSGGHSQGAGSVVLIGPNLSRIQTLVS